MKSWSKLKSLNELCGSFPRKKKMTRRGIEPGLYEMHEFLQVDFCKFLPVAFATKNLARAVMLQYVAESGFDSSTRQFFSPFFIRLRTECMNFCK